MSIHTNAELLVALFGEDEAEAMFAPIPVRTEPEQSFCCKKPIESYSVPCPHCGEDPNPF